MSNIKLNEKQRQMKINDVFENAFYCHVAFSDVPQPYILAFSYGFHDGCLYFHGSLEGKKIDLIQQNPHIGFAMEHAVSMRKAEKACKFAMSYASVVGSGKAVIIEDLEEKAFGLNVIIGHYGAPPEEYSEKALKGLSVVKIEIDEVSYKEKGL
jgi:nitroimidazol reductase NimA-like FMN-containing flavoprotein (pyridoxamine 5'-phosphate oxidase superfamily)